MEHFYQNIEGWFDFDNIYTQMVNKFQNNSHFVEIGSWLGKSTSYMAVEILNSGKNIQFDCIDTWEGSIASDIEKEQVKELSNLSTTLFDEFLKNTEKVKNYINPIKKYSYDAVNDYDDESIDFLFIDAAHDYESVKKDLNDWYSKVKKNGIIGGHDYIANFPGVINAVNEYFGVKNINIDNTSWIVYNEQFSKNNHISMRKEDISHPIGNFFDMTYSEIIEKEMYERFFEVQNNDLIVDIGSNIGLFPISVIDKFSKCYVIEPDPLNFISLKENLSTHIDKVIFINEGISNKNTISSMTEHGGTGLIKKDGTIKNIINRNFRNFIENYKIENINFLKMDCEGGEYFIITNDNKDILRKINVISGEYHFNENFLVGPDNTTIDKNDVIESLDILEDLFDVIYTSVDGVKISNIRERLDYYKQFLIYGTNKNLNNKIIVEYLDGYVKVESEKFDVDDPQLLEFIDTQTNTIIYSSEITNARQWSKTSTKVKECEVKLGKYSAKVSEEFPMKIITY